MRYKKIILSFLLFFFPFKLYLDLLGLELPYLFFLCVCVCKCVYFLRIVFFFPFSLLTSPFFFLCVCVPCVRYRNSLGTS